MHYYSSNVSHHVTSPEALKGRLLLLVHSCYIIPMQICRRESASDHNFLPASEGMTIIYLHPAPSGAKMPALCDRDFKLICRNHLHKCKRILKILSRCRLFIKASESTRNWKLIHIVFLIGYCHLPTPEYLAELTCRIIAAEISSFFLDYVQLILSSKSGERNLTL